MVITTAMATAQNFKEATNQTNSHSANRISKTKQKKIATVSIIGFGAFPTRVPKQILIGKLCAQSQTIPV